MGICWSVRTKYRLRRFRKVAHEIYKQYDFFELDDDEFLKRCYVLQRCGAGIVLGHPKNGYDVRIVELEHSQCGIYENVPLGRFGEICYKSGSNVKFTHTKLYGFCDQRGRIWCCGPISMTAIVDGKRYFPYCIEPLFERIWWVVRCEFYPDMSSFGHDGRGVVITTIPGVFCTIPFFKKYFMWRLQRFADRFPIAHDLSIVINNKQSCG